MRITVVCRLRHGCWVSLLISLVLLWPGGTLADDTWTNRFAGVKQLRRTTSTQRIHALQIDLTTPGVSLRATKSSERRQTVPSFGKAVSAEAAINGDFFLYTDYSTRGLAVGEGQRWPGSSDSQRFGFIRFDPEGNVRIQTNGDVTPFEASKMQGVVGGWPSIVAGGKALDRTGAGTHCTYRHPRTAVGLSQDNNTLWLVVVDGRQAGAIGMTCAELSALLVDLGAYRALSLDGGGSSAMWVKGLGVVSSPSDGSPRVVANHLAVQARSLDSLGVLEGTVHAAGDPSNVIRDAKVEVADVSVDEVNTKGVYRFKLPAGTYKLIARAPGYQKLEVSAKVARQQTKTIDLALEPRTAGQSSDDAGAVRDASVVADGAVDDASSAVDAGETPNPSTLDAAVQDEPRPGGCAVGAISRLDSAGLLPLAALWLRRRRRRRRE